MSHLRVSSGNAATRNTIKEQNESTDRNETEIIWVQKNRVGLTLRDAIEELKHCCIVLHLSQKCDERLGIPVQHANTEKYTLIARHGSSDNLKAMVTLLDDNVIQAEVTIKYPKAAGGYYRAVAQPDVQWKLQQLQDLGNHIARATVGLCEMRVFLDALSNFSKESGSKILSELKHIKNEICQARLAIQLPRKRSLLELCYFPPTRKFVPPLPQDQLLSFYISSCRLVCASYQMVPKNVNPQGLSIHMAECQLPHLDEILRRLNLAMNCMQTLIGYMDML
ncbi:unnamed protein product [Caenorhabditis bovis]|uniref:Protein rogdi n=1 Tax=Caenorhabditis bovis TaxID=2654633 RepID=A0A8S1ES72_9PELO|nr:unnamed protein product [Caenorhabditis bovis]